MVTLSSPGLTPANTELCDQLASVKARVVANWARAEELQEQTKRVLTETQAARRAIVEARRERRSSSARRDLTQRSEYARLLARLESMPVIEQAKGIIMAQSHCGDVQAFDLLRRASQRSNVPVRELAAQIVAKTVQVSPKPVKRLSGLDILMSPLGEPGVRPSERNLPGQASGDPSTVRARGQGHACSCSRPLVRQLLA
jgi:hypothetical protein